jgi:dienelactone hydrolase
MQQTALSPIKGPLHRAEEKSGRAWRESFLVQLSELIAGRRREADVQRRANLPRVPTQLRREIVELLGWPLVDYSQGQPAKAEEVLIDEDRFGKTFRLWIETRPGLRSYALLAVPSSPGPHPLVLAQHGGAGAPEHVMALNGKSGNYCDFGQRLRHRRFAVLAPQLCLSWGKEIGLGNDQYALENELRHLGGSLAALEASRLLGCLDHVSRRPDIDAARIGMAGLSYGGFYALLIAALDERIRATYSSCFFNDRYRYTWGDLVWKGSAFRFLDPELAGLVAPRPLYIDLGRTDEIFATAGTEAAREQLAGIYAQSNPPGDLTVHIHERGHEFDRDDAPIEFLEKHLFVGRS